MDQDKKLSAYEDFFGKLVAVQTMTAVPYLVIGPALTDAGKVVMAKVDGHEQPRPFVGNQAENVLVGVLGASPDGTQLQLRMEFSAKEMPRGAYVRMAVRFPPGVVTYITVLEEYVQSALLIGQ